MTHAAAVVAAAILMAAPGPLLDGNVDAQGQQELRLRAYDPGHTSTWGSPSGSTSSDDTTGDDGTTPTTTNGGGRADAGLQTIASCLGAVYSGPDEGDSPWDPGTVLSTGSRCSPSADGAAAAAGQVSVPAPPPDPAVLAEEAIDTLRLPFPQANYSPDPPVEGLVNLQYWLWVDEEQWRSLSESVTARQTTVTATVEPVEVVWDMGEGVEPCAGPGEVWREGLGQGAESECGYTYAHTSRYEPGGIYDTSAVIRYEASWTCEGDCLSDGGDLGVLESPAASEELAVTERQSVVIR